MEDGLVFDVDFEEDNGYKAFRANEIICMEYKISKCSKCTLSFYNESKDNEFMYKIDLPHCIAHTKITAWYPVFKSNSSGIITVLPY